MHETNVLVAVEALLLAEPECADRDALAVFVHHSRALQSWLHSIDVRCSRRARLLAEQGQAEPAASLLGDEGQRSTKDAETVGEHERVCEAMPGFENALAGGGVSAGHLEAIANATRRLHPDVQERFREHEQKLLDAAAHERIETFERRCRELARRLAEEHDKNAENAELERQRAASKVRHWHDKRTGMWHLHAELDPVRYASMKRVLDAHLRAVRRTDGNSGVPWSQMEVQAFLNAIHSGATPVSDHGRGDHDTGAGAGAGALDIADRADHADHAAGSERVGGRRPQPAEPIPVEWRLPEVGLLISMEWLLGQAHEHGICETYDGIPIPIDTARRMCCDAQIIPYVLNGKGEVTDMGRSTRTINRAQRRKLRAMHRTCAGPDCNVNFEACHIHHVKFWTRDHGRSDIANLLPLCERHHHLVHEGGWTLTMTPDRVATWARPDGTVHHRGSTIDRAPNGVTPDVTPKSAPDSAPGVRPDRAPGDRGTNGCAGALAGQGDNGAGTGSHRSTRPPGTHAA